MQFVSKDNLKAVAKGLHDKAKELDTATNERIEKLEGVVGTTATAGLQKKIADNASGVATNKSEIAKITNATTGILAQAKTYADGKASANGESIAANTAAISQEVTRAKAAEKKNADAITVLNGDATVEGSVAKQIKDAKAEFGGTTTELTGRVEANERALKILNSADKTTAGSLAKLLSDAKTYADTAASKAKSEVIGGAGDTYNTLKKIQDLFENDSTGTTAIMDAIGTKVNQTAYDKKVKEIDTAVANNTKSITDIQTTIGKKKSDTVTTSTGIYALIDAVDAKANANTEELGNKVNKSDYDAKIKFFDESVASGNAAVADLNKLIAANTDKITANTTNIATNASDISTLKDAINNASTGLKARMTAVETKATANAGEITKLKTTISKMATSDTVTNLNTKVADLETAVGNANSGLVKSVNTLKATVGDAKTGLVKDLADLRTRTSAVEGKLADITSTVVSYVSTKISEVNETINGLKVTGSYNNATNTVTVNLMNGANKQSTADIALTFDTLSEADITEILDYADGTINGDSVTASNVTLDIPNETAVFSNISIDPSTETATI